MKRFFYLEWLVCLFLSACTTQIPKEAELQTSAISIVPDYSALTIPCNIAPLNFSICEKATRYITHIYSTRGKGIVLSGKKVCIDPVRWHTLLSENKGDTLQIEIYLDKKGKWEKYSPLKNWIAPEEIDPYLSYRLIEPSYITYETLTINQRDLTGFDEEPIYSNFSLTEGQCINCHSYQNYNKTGNMQMHVRQQYGGTVIVTGNRAEKVNLKTDHTISAGVYPSWHPTEKLIAYSVNSTGQNFHTKDRQKIEVLDSESDLILYDVEKHEIRDIASDKNELETFPYWSADGKALYYVSARFEPETDDRVTEIINKYTDIKYNIYRKPFDPRTKEFGKTDTIFMASEYGKSATFPRESPDGKYLLFTLGDFGNFHIWHKNSDLYLMNLQTRDVRPLTEINSPEVESYHSWSSNGRWIIFSSRRDDGSYTRPYIAYFDREGRAHKPFILPQKDPDFYTQFFKSYNIPEFMAAPITVSRRQLVKAIEKDPENVVYYNPRNESAPAPETKNKENFYE